jgi:hypothetical protein
MSSDFSKVTPVTGGYRYSLESPEKGSSHENVRHPALSVTLIIGVTDVTDLRNKRNFGYTGVTGSTTKGDPFDARRREDDQHQLAA